MQFTARGKKKKATRKKERNQASIASLIFHVYREINSRHASLNDSTNWVRHHPRCSAERKSGVNQRLVSRSASFKLLKVTTLSKSGTAPGYLSLEAPISWFIDRLTLKEKKKDSGPKKCATTAAGFYFRGEWLVGEIHARSDSSRILPSMMNASPYHDEPAHSRPT